MKVPFPNFSGDKRFSLSGQTKSCTYVARNRCAPFEPNVLAWQRLRRIAYLECCMEKSKPAAYYSSEI
jgi:hypothetical protein